MQYLRVVNWTEFQHYKDRNPPWIKLHNQILEHYDFTSLPDTTKGHLIGLWLLASRTDNKIPNDPKWIASKLSATTPIKLELLLEKGFIELHPDSNVLAERSTACTVTAPSEEERREEKSIVEKSRRFTPPLIDEVIFYCLTRKNGIDPQAFLDHYESNGWMRGGNKIKDWKACIRTWEAKRRNDPKTKPMINKITDRTWAE